MSNLRLQGNASGTGTLTIASPNTNSDFTLNLPASGGTIPVLSSVTNNGVVFINSSGQATSGSGLVFDASGNLGLGVTPSTWSGATGFQLANGAFVGAAGRYFYIGANTYFNGSWRYTTSSGGAARYDMDGSHAWFVAPSGTAGNAISFTQAMTLDASGNLGIGTSSPGSRLDVAGAISSVNGYQDNLVLQNALSGSRNRFILGQSLASGAYIYTDAPGGVASPLPMTFWTAGSERMRIDSSGNVGIGTSSPQRALNVVASSSSTTIGGSTAVIQVGNSNGGSLNLTAGIELFGSGAPSAGLGNRSAGIYGLYESFNASGNAGALVFATNSAGSTSVTERARIASNGQMSTTTGTGSVMVAYDARAWVNFNGTGTVAISASGNVSSITDNGVGNYTVNFTTAMPDANFAVNAITNSTTGDASRPIVAVRTGASTTTATIQTVGTFNNNTNVDCSVIAVTIHR